MSRLDYSFVIIILCCLMVMISLGFCSTPKGIFTKPVSEANGMTRSAFSLSNSARYITTAIVNVFFGTLIYKFGPKKLICAGFSSLILSMMVYSFATNTVVFCIGGALLGLGLSFTTTTMVGAVVTRWCKKNKGTIMGLALASNGIGGAIAIQILGPIISSGVFAYKNAYRLVAVILAAMLVLIILFFRSYPKTSEENTQKATLQKKQKPDYKVILKTSYFYPAAFFIFTAGMVLQGVYGIAAPLFEDSGIASDTVTDILSISALCLFITKFGVGFIYDKTGVRHTSTICYSSAIVSVIMLFIVSKSASIPLAYAYTAFAALALPLETIMLPIYSRELFGEKRFNEALGLFASINTAGYAVGEPLSQLCFDLFGSYTAFINISVVMMAIALVTIHIVITASRKKAAESEAELNSETALRNEALSNNS